MTDRLERIRERLEKATPGPWEHATDYLGDGVFSERIRGTAYAITRGEHYPNDTARMRADGDFIAHSRVDVPWLLAEVERLRATLGRLGDGSGFVAIGFIPEGIWGDEIKARMAYARKMLEG